MDELVPAIVTGESFDFRVPLFKKAEPVIGATVSLDELRDDTDTDVLGGAVALLETEPGIYEANVVFAFPPGEYRAFVSATGAAVDLERRFLILVKPEEFMVNAGLAHPDLCLVYGRLVDNMARPVIGAKVNVYYRKESMRYDNVSSDAISTTTDDNGFFALSLIRSTEAALRIAALDYNVLIKVPDAATAEFRTLVFDQPSVLGRGPFGHVLPVDL